METDKEILKYYKFVYTCDCGQKYGKGPHICPSCEEKLKI